MKKKIQKNVDLAFGVFTHIIYYTVFPFLVHSASPLEVFPLLKQSMSVSRYYKKSPAKSPHRKTDKKNKSSTILGHCTKRHQTITDGTTITTKLFKHSKHDLAGNPTHIAARLKKI